MLLNRCLKCSILGALCCVLASGAQAEDCTLRTAQALEQLQVEVTGRLEVEQALQAKRILDVLCETSLNLSDAQPSDRNLRTVPASSTSADDTPEPPLTVFGVEVRKAPRDSKGNERLRRKH